MFHVFLKKEIPIIVYTVYTLGQPFVAKYKAEGLLYFQFTLKALRLKEKQFYTVVIDFKFLKAFVDL